MEEEIKMDDIDQSYRLGASAINGKSRPIIIFLKYNTRCRVFKNKKKLNGKDISIAESLMKKRREVRKKATEKHGFEFVD